MSKYTEKDIQALVDAATNACASTGGAGKGALHKALEPFRPKRPRVAYLAHEGQVDGAKGVELTPEVIARLGPTGGVDREAIRQIQTRSASSIDNDTTEIMQLIEAAGVEVE